MVSSRIFYLLAYKLRFLITFIKKIPWVFNCFLTLFSHSKLFQSAFISQLVNLKSTIKLILDYHCIMSLSCFTKIMVVHLTFLSSCEIFLSNEVDHLSYLWRFIETLEFKCSHWRYKQVCISLSLHLLMWSRLQMEVLFRKQSSFIIESYILLMSNSSSSQSLH